METKIKNHITTVKATMVREHDFGGRYVNDIDFTDYAYYLEKGESVKSVHFLKAIGLNIVDALNLHKVWVQSREDL